LGSSRIAVVVFDLGGVLLELREARTNFGFDGDDSTFNETWLRSAAVRRFERGDIDRDAFSVQVMQELRFPYDSEEFLRRFERWPKALYPGIDELIDALPDNVEKALLSNTNAVHWGEVILEMPSYPTWIICSCLLKPDF
jgi:putative hydrolase of the HAD superfamily